MAIKLFKDGKVCNADKDQVATMEKAGWSRKEPKKAVVEPSEGGAKNEGGGAKAPAAAKATK